MTTIIYYFTGTGNSLAVARDIAMGINGNMKSISITENQHEVTPLEAKIGIVFPVYYATNGCSGMPLAVERFLDKLTGIDNKYVFAICTHHGMPGNTLNHLATRIEEKGGSLAAGFAVQLYKPPGILEKLKTKRENKVASKAREKTILARQEELLEEWIRETCPKICNHVNRQDRIPIESKRLATKIARGILLHLFIKPIFSARYRKLSDTSGLNFKKMVKLADRSYKVDEDSCTGCGTCVSVCPVENIKMIDGIPGWLHHCENCFACYTWCPSKAIHGEIVAYAERYHHPSVHLRDMIVEPSPDHENIRLDGR